MHRHQCRMQPAGEPVQWTGWTEYPSAGRSVIGPWTGWTVWTGVLDRLDRLLHDSVLLSIDATNGAFVPQTRFETPFALPPSETAETFKETLLHKRI